MSAEDVDSRHPVVPNPPTGRPLLVYDGECPFCIWWLSRWRRRIGGRLDYEPFQRAASRFPALPRERFERSVQLIETDGRVYQGAEAIFRVLSLVPGHGFYRWVYERVPGGRAVTERVYRFIAGHRPAFYRLTLWIWGDTPRAGLPPGRRTILEVLASGVLYGVLSRRRRRKR